MKLNYKKTLENSIKRKSKFIDHNTQFYNRIPLMNWIEISPIDACNRKCVFCPKSDDQIAPDTFKTMKNETIEKLSKELREIDYKGTVVFAGYGEPLLDKNIFKKISLLSDICNVEITTNGDPLNKNNILKLIKSGIHKIVVSLYDGPEQIEQFKKLFLESGVSDDKYVLRDRWYKEDDGWGLMVTNRAGTLNLENKNLPKKTTSTCYYTHYSMMIDWNGNCYLCTQDWNRKVISGNITKQNIIDIWNSDILKKFRSDLVSGKRINSPCKNCNAFGLMHGEKHAKAWDDYYNKYY
jgi:radical SAM protein with 4Fe4S-binding SPASM domain